MTSPTVKEILESYLKDHGYDGLCTIDCGCFIGDLAECGDLYMDCQAGYETWRKDPTWGCIREISITKPKEKK